MLAACGYRGDIRDTCYLYRRSILGERNASQVARRAPDPYCAVRLYCRAKRTACGNAFHIREPNGLHWPCTNKEARAVAELSDEVCSPAPDCSIRFQREHKRAVLIDCLYSIDAGHEQRC